MLARLYPAYHCHHLHTIIHVSPFMSPLDVLFFPQIHHLSVVMSSFCFLPCNVSRRYSYIRLSSHLELVRCLLYHPSTPLSHTSFMLMSSLFISPRCACACLCFTLSPHSPRFDRHSPSSLLLLSYAFYSSVLVVPSYLCFILHMRMFPFLLQNPALLTFASLHTLPPLCLSTLDRWRSHPPTLVPSSLPETYRIPIYNQPPIPSHTDPS